jgi:DNA-binding PadR family transcriptional regulator
VDHKLIEQIDETSQERNKKIYQLTEEGKKILQYEVDILKEKLEEIKLIMNQT